MQLFPRGYCAEKKGEGGKVKYKRGKKKVVALMIRPEGVGKGRF